ncbi:hypothetical protein F3Y22_tig00111659pilonHSYRG00196 [Hibiscus syriacus]|uniref:NPK1-activating kinesin-like protein C-terminal domain-containing protein n=1 Tax=Hibiscus syriacus TaxID=106335 RepID=A0A6A2XYT0_HIBSY|nr:hypothetical protein F3Y22_tig00111659pilonHSYRG00196 [Hibiscus syriacus]
MMEPDNEENRPPEDDEIVSKETQSPRKEHLLRVNRLEKSLQWKAHLKAIDVQVLELEANEAAGHNLEDDKSEIEPEEPQLPCHNHFAELGNASPALVGDERAVSMSSSIRALKHKKEFLAERLTSRLSAEERDALYVNCNVPLVGKQSRLQFINNLWTDPHDAKNIEESAQIVAKLVGFSEGGNMSREMFKLNFALPADKNPWIMGWNQISNLLNL